LRRGEIVIATDAPDPLLALETQESRTAACGRFHLSLRSEIHALYRLTTPPANLQPRYNFCPTTPIKTVVTRDGKNELVPMRRGLIPSWWKKKAKEEPATFDARAETVADRPMFKSAFKRARCLISSKWVLQVARYSRRQTALLLHSARRAASNDRGAVRRMEGYRNRRAAEVLHYDHHGGRMNSSAKFTIECPRSSSWGTLKHG
jgi:SOS response associated peptidase (SRAP)